MSTPAPSPSELKKRRKVRLRLLLGIALTILFVAPILTIFIELRQRQYRDALMEKAKTAWAAGDADKAQLYLTLFLEKRPGQFEAISMLGDILAKKAKTGDEKRQAREVLRSVLAAVPGRRDDRKKVIDLSMGLGDFADAANNIEELIDGASEEELGGLEYQLAQCRESTRQFDKAIDHYQLALAKSPTKVEAYAAASRLIRRESKDAKRADALMDKMVEANPGSSPAFLERGLYRKENGLVGAKADVAAARKLAPDDPQALLAATEMGVKTWDTQEVESLRKDLAASLKAHPKDARLNLVEATLLGQIGQLDAAIKSLRQGIENDPDARNMRWMLADVLIDVKKPEEAREQIDELRKRDVRPALTDYLEARIKMADEQWAQAIVIFERIRGVFEELPGSRAQVGRIDLMLARAYESIPGESERREAAYRRAIAADPESVEARQGLARAAFDKGAYQEALGIYRGLEKSSPLFAVEVARTALLTTLAVPKENRDWASVQKLIDEATRVAPDSPVVPLIQADLLNARGKFDDAASLLEKLKTSSPDRIEPRLALAETKAIQGKLGEAQSKLDETQKALGDRVEIRLARAKYLVRSEGSKAADALVKLTQDIDKFSQSDQRKLLTGLGVDFARINAVEQSAALWDQLTRRFPNDLGGWLGVFDQAFRDKNLKSMETALETIRGIEGKSGRWGTFCEIRMLVFQFKQGDVSALGKARALAADLTKKNPTWVAVALQMAEIEDLNGDRKKARAGYVQAIAMGSNDPMILRRTIELLHAAGDDAQARRLLDRLRRQGPVEGDFRRIAGEVDVRSGDANSALEAARKAVADGSRDYKDHLWLARLLWNSNQKAEVEPRIREAIALKPDAGETWIALEEYYVADNQKEKAESALKEAEAALSKDKKPLPLAICNERAGHAEIAESLYKAAVAKQPDDPAALRFLADFALRRKKPGEAEEPLRKLSASKTAGAADVIWADENLADLLSEGGDNAKCDEALKLLDAAAKLNRDPTDAESARFGRVKARVLARQPGHPRRKEAIRLLEEVVVGPDVQPYDQFLLAQLLEEDGNWAQAQKYLDVLLPSQGKNLEYLASYARGLLRKDDANGARPLLEKMKQVDPKAFPTYEIDARIRRVEGHGAAAATILQPFLKDKDDRVVLQAAAVLEELGQFDQAEAGYREYASRAGGKSADGDLNLSMFLARRDRPGEALDLCDKARGRAGAEVVAKACMYVLATSKVGDADRDRVAKSLEAAFAENPKNGMIALRLATIRDVQGRFAEAEPMYRKSIELEDKPSLPLNNLAWLLAFQEGKASEALEMVNRAIAISGTLPDLLDTRGVIYLALGENYLAVKDLEPAAVASPTPARLFHLSQAYYAGGDLRSATTTYQKAVSVGLSEQKLHALELPAYKKLSAELGKK